MEKVLTLKQKEELALERFKDWYFEQLEQDEWELPMKQVVQQIPSSAGDLNDLLETIRHHYRVHIAYTWEVLQNEIEDQGADYYTYLQSYIIQITKP